MDYTPLSPVVPFIGYRGQNTAIPSLYWNEWTAEQRIRCICEELRNVECYAADLGVQTNLNIDTINELGEILEQLQNGGWFDEYAEQIQAWIEDIQNLSQLVDDRIAANETISDTVAAVAALEAEIDGEGGISDRLTAAESAISTETDDREDADTALSGRIDALETEAEGWTANIDALALQTIPTHANRIVAHRGAQRTAPENTLLAMRNAKRYFYKHVEFDVRPTFDGHFVCCHDADISSYTAGTGLCRNLTLAAIQSYPITKGYGIEAVPITQPTQYIPEITEMLRTLKGLEFDSIIVDLKDSQNGAEWNEERVRQVVDLVERFNLQNCTSYGSFYDQHLTYVKNYRPDAYVIRHTSAPTEQNISTAASRGFDAMTLPYSGGSTWVDVCRSYGLDAYMSGFGDEDAYYYAQQWGIAGYFIDNLAFLPRTSATNGLTPYGRMNGWGGSLTPLYCEFAARQAERGGFIPAIRPYPMGGTSVTPGISEPTVWPSPIWDGQAQHMCTPPIRLEVGTVVHFDDLDGTYEFTPRIWNDDFTSFYSGDNNAWEPGGTYVIAASPEMNVGAQEVPRPVWVTFLAHCTSGRAVSELDCTVMDHLLTWSSQRSSLMLYSTADGVSAGYGFRGVMEPLRLWSGIFPTGNGATIPIPEDPANYGSEYSVHVYIYGANGKRLVDSGALTADYTVSNANAAYARYVFMMANAAQYISPRVWGHLHETYKIICSPVM